MDEIKQASFEGWALVELMGHQKEIGYVTTEAYGAAVLFRIDTPEIPEHEFELERPEYIGVKMLPAGAKVKRPALPAKSRMVGSGSIYAINPCTEEVAMKAIESEYPRRLIVLSIPEQAQLPSGADPFADMAYDPDDHPV